MTESNEFSLNPLFSQIHHAMNAVEEEEMEEQDTRIHNDVILHATRDNQTSSITATTYTVTTNTTGTYVATRCWMRLISLIRIVYKEYANDRTKQHVRVIVNRFVICKHPYRIICGLLMGMDSNVVAHKKETKNKRSAASDSTWPTETSDSYWTNEQNGSWFTSLLRRTTLARIGTPSQHAVQISLLTEFMMARSDSISISDEITIFARDALLLKWISVPSVFLLILDVFRISLSRSDKLFYFRSVVENSHHVEASVILRHFHLVETSTAEELILPLLNSGSDGNESLAVTLAGEKPVYRVFLVRVLSDLGRWSLALKLIHRWSLNPDDFPATIHAHRIRHIHWLIAHRKCIELGPEACGDSIHLQSSLIQELLLVHELDQAKMIAQSFDPSVVSIIDQFEANLLVDPVRAAAVEEARAAAKVVIDAERAGALARGPCLQLPATIPIHWVDGLDSISLNRAECGLFDPATTEVGLDVEFSFGVNCSSTRIPALLQIATRREVFLFDLLTFSVSHRMAEIFSRLFRSPSILKVGFAWEGDTKVLRDGFPNVTCFNVQRNMIDLVDVAKEMDRLRLVKEAEIKREERAKEEAIATATDLAQHFEVTTTAGGIVSQADSMTEATIIGTSSPSSISCRATKPLTMNICASILLKRLAKLPDRSTCQIVFHNEASAQRFGPFFQQEFPDFVIYHRVRVPKEERITSTTLNLTKEDVATDPKNDEEGLTEQDTSSADSIRLSSQRPKPRPIVRLVGGSVKDRHCFIVSDIVRSGGSLQERASELLRQGASKVSVFAIHPIFPNDAHLKFMAANLSHDSPRFEHFLVTDSNAAVLDRLHGVLPFEVLPVRLAAMQELTALRAAHPKRPKKRISAVPASQTTTEHTSISSGSHSVVVPFPSLNHETFSRIGLKGQSVGLSELCRRCIGLPLDKSCQVSSWRRRPLRLDQERYAALDAYCLLDILDMIFLIGKRKGEFVELGLSNTMQPFVQSVDRDHDPTKTILTERTRLDETSVDEQTDL